MTGTSVGLSVKVGSPPKSFDVDATNPLPVSLAAGSAGGSSATPNYSVGATGTPAASTLGAVNATSSAFDALNYQSVAVQVSGTFVGTQTFEVSNDNTNWVAKVLTSSIGVPTQATTTPGVFFGDIGARYFRVRTSAFTSGSATVTAVYDALSLTPAATTAVSVSAALPTGSNTIGNVSNTVLPPTATGVNVVTAFMNAALPATATLVKATQGKILRYRIYNPSAAVLYVQAFNAASAAAVTVGTTAPLEVYPVPAGAVLDADIDFSFNYSAGIVVAATTTPTGNTAPATAPVVTLGYV